MTQPLVLQDLSPHTPADPAEDAWLARLAARLRDNDHVIRLTGGQARVDDEDEAALTRGTDGRWWAGRYIGELRFEDREIRIEPRLGIDVIGEWLASALNVTAIPKSAAIGPRGPLIVELIDRVWSAAVADAARHGTPKLRRVTRHDQLYVRGRIDIPGTAKHRAAGSPLITTVRHDRDLDNPVSRTIVLADRALRSLLSAKPTWRPIRTATVLAQLRGVVGAEPELPSPAAVRAVRYTPISRRYEGVTRLSYEIVKRRGHLTSASGADVSGVLLDVAELWELFLLHCARRAFGPERVEHGTAQRDGTHLLRAQANQGIHLGRLKPDILVRDGKGQVCAVIDAKYKRLRSWVGSPSGVDRGDLYQLAAYLSGHDTQLGMLAYPPHDIDTALAHDAGPWLTTAGQTARFERIPAGAAGAVEALRAAANAALQFATGT
jgi:5-methylcytosine-specific restriction enzyme subunit McrC